MGTFTRRALPRFKAKPLRSYWFPSLTPRPFEYTPFTLCHILGYYPLDLGCFAKGLCDGVRLDIPAVLFSSILSETPWCPKTLVIEAFFGMACALVRKDRHYPKKIFLSELRGRFRAYTLYLAELA